jgi:peptidoglycan-N-acetylglucosamine deacetylase
MTKTLPQNPLVSPLNAMSVDVEDYYHAEALIRIRGQIGSKDVPERFEGSTARLLDLFGEHNVKATFFTLGWIAERAPHLIRRIVDEGHELGCHSYEHVRIGEQSPDIFRSDLKRAKQALEDASGVAPQGYRAPTFSLSEETQWAYHILIEEGFSYSSSIYPVHHDLYGMPGASRVPFHPVEGSRFLEIPMSTVVTGGRVMQGGGGGYFRLLPYGMSARLIRKVHREEHQPFMFYFHPWEVDTGQPRISNLPIKSRVRHYTNLGRMEKKLERLLQDFSWGRVDQAFPGLENPGVTAPSSPEQESDLAS